MCGCPRIKRLDSYESKSKFIRYSEAFFSNFFTGGLFWAKNRKSSKNAAFCQKSSDLNAKHVVRRGLTHKIRIFCRIWKILKIADFMDKSVDAKIFFLPLRRRAAFAQKSLDFWLKYLVGRVLAQTFRISWQIWKILKIADFMIKILRQCLFSFFAKIRKSAVDETIGRTKNFTKYDL